MKRRNPALTIQIPEPCRQSWDEMTPKNGGRHCTACAKTVTDFTRMSDAQILEVMRSSAGGCGRFRENQVNRKLVMPPAVKKFSLGNFYKLVASLLMVFSAGKVVAQEKKEVPIEETTLKASQTISNRLSGFVTDDTGEPLTGAKIEVIGYDTAFIAGIDGEFKMDIPDSTFQKGNVKISVFFPGYKIEEMILSREDFPLHLQATLVKISTDSASRGSFQIIEETVVERMPVRDILSFVGTFSFIPENEIRAKERELQYKHRENRLEEFIQDYGH